MENILEDFKIEGESVEVKERVEDWVLSNPVKVKSVTGDIDEESADLVIWLTNNHKIEFHSHYEAGPPSSYWRDTGKKDPNYATIDVWIGEDEHLYKVSVKEEFLEMLAEDCSIVMTVLKLYKKHL